MLDFTRPPWFYKIGTLLLSPCDAVGTRASYLGLFVALSSVLSERRKLGVISGLHRLYKWRNTRYTAEQEYRAVI